MKNTKALRSHVKLLTRLAEGECNHNELASQDVKISMVCNDFGYYGDICFDFYKGGKHVLAYETELAYGKAKPGHYTTQSTRVSDEKIVAQFKAALAELNYPVTPARWVVIDEGTKAVRYSGSDDFLARLNYAAACADETPASLAYFAPGISDDSDMMEWNCDLDTGVYDVDAGGTSVEIPTSVG